MASSKDPIEAALVPAGVVAFAKDRLGVGVNLRPEQEVDPGDRQHRHISTILRPAGWMHDSATRVISSLERGSRFLMLFQGYGPEHIGVGVVESVRDYNGATSCVRLDFVRPPLVDTFLGGAGFWSSFVLAIMCVDRDTPLFMEEDDIEGTKFLEHATRLYQG